MNKQPESSYFTLKDYQEKVLLLDESEVKTANGWPVRIFCTNLAAHRPIIGAILNPDTGQEQVESWTDAGFYDAETSSNLDLMIVEKLTDTVGWLNVYPGHKTYWYGTRSQADIAALPHRMACLEVIPGTGL